MPDRSQQPLFPPDAPRLAWTEFPAAGYAGPACGVIYPEDKPATCGMPLGGIDTGCIDLGTNGLLGFVTAFNTLTPRRGPLNEPFLGLRLDGRTFLLAGVGMPGAEPAARVRYWGHYPIADVEFTLDCPLSVGLRAWSPFVPGDVDASLVPGAVFEVTLRNPSDRPQAGKLAISFAGFERHYTTIYRQPVRGANGGANGGAGGGAAGEAVSGGANDGGAFSGAVSGHGTAQKPLVNEASYALGVIGDVDCHLGYHFGWDSRAWQSMGSGTFQVPGAGEIPVLRREDDNSGMSITVDFAVAAGEAQTVRFVLAWYAPYWYGNGTRAAGGNAYKHMYASRFGSALEAANFLAANHAALLRRVIAWQEVLYGEKSLPLWLRDSLINILHLITETSVWAQAEAPIGEWCRPEDGLFGLNECPRGCPQIECLPCSFYGNLPVVYFFPHLARSTLRGYKAYQFADGRPAWVFGGVTASGNGFYEMAQPHRGYQQALNGCCAVEMVNKMWLRTGDDELLKEFYDFCKRATLYTMTLRPEYGDRQVISMPSGDVGTEWFEAPEPGWAGMAAHIGAIRLAHLQMAKRMAECVGDPAFAAQCQQWFEAGSQAMEETLWTGSYYLNFCEPESGKKSDLVFGYQLDGQWIAKFHGLPDALPAGRVRAVLDTIKRYNVALSQSGAVNYTNPDGSPAPVGGYGTYSYFPPELLMLAMTYMYHGELEFGLDLAGRCWENIVCKQRLTWDQPNFFRGDLDTGERTFGNDYYQNMMLWSLAAAVSGQDLSGPCAPGGLVERVIAAGRQP